MKVNKLFTILAVLTFLFLILGLYSPDLKADEKIEEKFEKTVALSKEGEVFLNNISGDIVVKSWGKAEVKIDAVKFSKASSLEKAKENAQRVEIAVEKEGDTLRVETKYPRTFGRSLNVSVNYTLMIPDKASVKIKSVSGDITLEEMGGAVKASAVSGDVEMMGAQKGVDCKTVSGDLKLRDIKGDVYLKAVSGDITLEEIQGSIEAETVSGGIKMIGVSKAQTVKCKVLSGDIVYQGEISPDGRYDLNSHSGKVEMVIPPSSAFNLEASTFSGKIQSDFEISVTGTISKRKIQGSVNGGGADLTVSTFSGDVYLRKK